MRQLILLLLLLYLPIAILKADIIKVSRYDISNGLSDDHITCAIQDEQGLIWVATWNGLNRFDGYNFARVGNKGPAVQHVRNMFLGHDNLIWCRMDGEEYYCFNPQDYSWQNVSLEQWEKAQKSEKITWKPLATTKSNDISMSGLPDGKCLGYDRQGNLWTILHYEGLAKFTNPRHVATHMNGIEQVNARAMMTDKKGRLWIATKEDKCIRIYKSNGTLIGWLDKEGKINTEKVSFGVMAYSILQDSNGDIWIGAKQEGLIRLRCKDEYSWQVEHLNIDAVGVYDLAQDKKGRLWIATQKNGLKLIEQPTEKCPIAITPENYPADKGCFVRRLLISKKGYLLCATNDGLIVGDIKSESMTFTLHQHEDQENISLGGHPVVQLSEDEKGNIYVCSNSGIDRIASDNPMQEDCKFEHLYHSKNILVSMTIDKNRIIAVCTNSVVLLSLDGHEQAVLGSQFWDEKLRFSEVKPLQLNDGQWIFGHEKGAFLTNENDWVATKQPLKIIFSSVKITNKVVDISITVKDTLILSPEQRHFSLSFAALDYSDNSAIQYRTRLDDSEWNDMGTDRVLTFFDLKPGKHKLQVCSTDEFGRWTDNVRTLVVIAQPTFWETIWAKILIASIIVFVAFAITYTYLYIRNLRRKQQETLKAYLALLEEDNPTTENSNDNSGRLQLVTPQKAHINIKPEDEAFMQRVLNYVEANLGNSDANISDMAMAVAVSETSLYRKMNSLLGASPGNFLQEARLSHAAKMLRSDKLITDIAFACGFESPKYFRKCFKKRFGMSPTDYRDKQNHATI